MPQGTTIIPSEYTIFLNADDDRQWQGVKRRGLEQGLYHILAERAKEIAGKKKLETKSFVIELRIDATLQPGEVRVQHSWEDSTSNKTGVLSRPKDLPPLPEAPQPAATRATNPNVARPASASQGVTTPSLKVDPRAIPPTVADIKVNQVVPVG